MNLKKSLENIRNNNCVIEIFGLGYVGFPLSIRLATSGYDVIGIDKDENKLKRLKQNDLLYSEIYLKNEFIHCKNNNKIRLNNKSSKSNKPKITIICVPTPIPSKLEKSNVFVVNATNEFLNTAKRGDVLIVESSVEVGTIDELEKKVKRKRFEIGNDLGLCFCPERIDPMNSKWELENIPRIIYCSDNTTFQIAQEVYKHVNNSNLIRVESAKTAEVIKSFENTFRLVNISLVNELAILCDKLNVNVNEVIKSASTKPFGFMPFYPSAGAGGHCIPKDPIFLLKSAKKNGVHFDTLEKALQINSKIPEYVVENIIKLYKKHNLKKSILISGLSYKPNIEDMRDSPGFKIVKKILNKKFQVIAHDPYYKKEIHEKYLKENKLDKIKLKIIKKIDDEIIKEIDLICIVQPHIKSKLRLNEIYKKSQVSIIYDCQNTLKNTPHSKTILKKFGS